MKKMGLYLVLEKLFVCTSQTEISMVWFTSLILDHGKWRQGNYDFMD